MPAYLIADTHITDQTTYDTYKQRVVVEFPDMATLKSWYNSPEYAPLLALRQPAATDHLVAVPGA